MSNFHSNYKDIHKQIAIADFTDEQIQELMTALQTKRSAKSKLTKEEKVFYQCCRERRSYANNQDFMYLYHGVSSKFLDYYLALFYWIEKNKDKSYLDQAYDIITLLSNQTKKIPLAKFKGKPISFDLKGLLD